MIVHPRNPDIVYAGTQSGPYRSADRGEHWEKVDIADHGLPVWSFLFHPYDPDVVDIGDVPRTGNELCVPPKSDESCRWEAWDGRWVSLTIGTGDQFGSVIVAASDGRTEIVSTFEDALALAKVWRG